MAFFPLSGSAELAARINSFPWERTELGPLERWPENLRTALSILLGSRFPMQLLWGSSYLHFYNDAYIPIAADKHPQALGRPGALIWPEIWELILPTLEQVRSSGEPSWAYNQLLVLERNQALEEGYFTFSYSPIRGASEQVEGVFVAVTETTRGVIAERRLHSIRDLGAALAGLNHEETVLRAAERTLSQNRADIPFALCYLLDEARQSFRLTASFGVPEGHQAAPPHINLSSQADTIWQLTELFEQNTPFAAERSLGDLPLLPIEPWGIPATTALALPLRADTRVVMGFLIVGLSPRQRLTNEYAEFAEELGNQVAAALTNARNHSLATLAVRVRDDFLSIAAHELKSPLTPLITRLQLLHRRLARANIEQRHLDELDKTAAEAMRLAKMIDLLLDISRLRNGQLSIQRTTLDLGEIASRIVLEIEPTLDRHTLTLELPGEAALLEGDELRLEQMLRNLVNNAVKYSPNGGAITVRVALSQLAVTLVVSDQGIGIAPEMLPLIFERYYRAAGAGSGSIGGFGIGLFVVHEIVRLHGGTISVASTAGAGTSFTVVLPVAPHSLAASSVADSAMMG
jgi:signal transduction histidine kinase